MFCLLSPAPLHGDLLRNTSSLWCPVQHRQQERLGCTVLIQLRARGRSSVPSGGGTAWGGRTDLERPAGEGGGAEAPLPGRGGEAGCWLDWPPEGRIHLLLPSPLSFLRNSSLWAWAVFAYSLHSAADRQVWTGEGGRGDCWAAGCRGVKSGNANRPGRISARCVPAAANTVCLQFLLCFSRQRGELAFPLIFGFRTVKLLAERVTWLVKGLSQDLNAGVLALNHCVACSAAW